ncbi:unnamed protein product, partial [Thlaspi arvense]
LSRPHITSTPLFSCVSPIYDLGRREFLSLTRQTRNAWLTWLLFFYSLAIGLLLYCLLNLGTLLNRRSLPLPPGPRPWPNIAAMARTYGPLMHLRLGMVHVVVAASASVAAQFLKTHDANFCSRPPNSGAKYMAYNYQDLVFAPYGPRWRMLRKICSVHLFSTKALDDFRHVRQEETARLTRALAGAGHLKAVNLGQLLGVCTTNALGRVMLGRRVFSDGSEEVDPKADEFKQMVVELMVLAGVFNIGDFVPAASRKMKKLHARFDAFLNAIMDEHKLGEGNHSDLLTTLISLKDNADGEGGKLSDVEIKALLLDLFTAGTDTSASTVEWAIAELIRHPNILARAQQELDTIVGPADW